MNKNSISLSLEPKARFLAGEAQAKQWNLTAESALFSAALEAALLEFTRNQSPYNDGAVAMAYKIKGAQEFVFTLLNIGIPSVAPSREDPMSLKEHSLGQSKAWAFDPSRTPAPPNPKPTS